jgi:hypothetical protein
MEGEVIKVKKEKTDRERQTFFRVTFKNNCNLLQIADNKANIIISINALVISSTIAIIGYGSISHGLDIKNPFTLIPVLLLLSTCLTSTILAVQAAKPKIMGKTPPSAVKPKSSMLFFGESSTYTLDEYLKEIERILPSKEEIHEHMGISLYYQGKVLNKKYSLLRHAYNVFILGLVIGILTFLMFMTVGSS